MAIDKNSSVDRSEFLTMASTVGISAPGLATTATAGIVKQSAAQANTAASDVAGLVTDFNALLAKLRTAGLLAT